MALATLALTIHNEGKLYAAHEGKTMLLGCAGFFVYALLVRFVLRRYRLSAYFTSIALVPVWFAVTLGSWIILHGR